jgi:hypothetical protein
MQDSQKLKERMKEHVDVLLQDFFEDLDLLRILPGVGLQVGITDINRLDQVVEGSGMGLFLIGGHWLKILLKNSKGGS